jgi:carotenoid cleavage dioxygenase-like enzyme
MGGVWQRFEIDLDDLSVNSYELLSAKAGGYELPAFNWLKAGQETCITYHSAFYQQQVIDDNYGWDFTKFDACEKNITATWHQPGYLPNEPHFVANP